MHLKGQNVNLLINQGAAYVPIAASTSCDLNITANNEDAAAKDDPGNGIFDNPEFVNYSYTMSNESFVVEAEFLAMLLDKVINGDAQLDIQYQMVGASGSIFVKRGTGIVTSMTVEAPHPGFAKVNISMDGNGSLENGTAVNIVKPASIASRIKGKALMVAMQTAENVWKTIACATGHRLSVTCATSDVTDKDYNDKAVLKEITSKSVTLTTDNLVENGVQAGAGINELYNKLTTGGSVKMAFGYYPDSIGTSIHGQAQSANGWGESDTVLLSGTFSCTSLNTSGANKEDVTFTAEFQNKGKVTVEAA